MVTPGMIVSCAPLISTRPGVSPLLAQLAGTRRYLDIMINGSSLDWVATPPARYHTALNIKIHILNSTSSFPLKPVMLCFSVHILGCG